jgi:hypothetical protein
VGQFTASQKHVDTTPNSPDGTVERGSDLLVGSERASHRSKKTVFLRRPPNPALILLWYGNGYAAPCGAHSVPRPMDRAVRLTNTFNQRSGLPAFDALARGSPGSDQRCYPAIAGLAMLLPMKPAHSSRYSR